MQAGPDGSLTSQQSRSEHARAVAERRAKNLRTKLAVEHMPDDRVTGLRHVQAIDIPDAAADDDGVGVEDIDHRGNGLAELRREPIQRTGGNGVASASAFDDVR